MDRRGVWARRVLAEVLTGAADAAHAAAVPPRSLWKVQVDGMAQASATLQVALAARLAGCSWLGIARALNSHGLHRLVNPQAVTVEPWDRDTVARAVLSVPREPGLAHVLGWFAREFAGGDLLEAVWLISAMDGTERHTTARAFGDAVMSPGLERALGVARAEAERPGGGRPTSRLGVLERDFGSASADIARACWYFLFGPGARGRLGYQRVLADAFRGVAADAVDAAGQDALEAALTERARDVDMEERAARAEAVRAARIIDRGKR